MAGQNQSPFELKEGTKLYQAKLKMRCNLTVEKEAQAQWKRDNVEAERDARCDIVAILRFTSVGGNKIELLLTANLK